MHKGRPARGIPHEATPVLGVSHKHTTHTPSTQPGVSPQYPPVHRQTRVFCGTSRCSQGPLASRTELTTCLHVAAETGRLQQPLPRNSAD